MSCAYCGTEDCPPCQETRFDRLVGEHWAARPLLYKSHKEARSGFYWFIRRQKESFVQAEKIRLENRQPRITDYSSE